MAPKSLCEASSFSEPHPHNGKVTPFEPGDPKVPLDGKALQILESGKPYKTQIDSGAGGRGLVVQDVHAPSDVVWGRILDYDNYSKMVPKTVDSRNYDVTKMKPSKKDPLSEIIFTRMKVGLPLLKLEFFIKHLYYPSLNSLTWTLDYTKKSDFDDSCGYWYIIPHPDKPQSWTRVYYSVEVSMFDWIPKFALDFISAKALVDATAWVKKFSELEYQKQGGDTATLTSDESCEEGTTCTQKKKKKKIFNLFKKFRKDSKKAIIDEIQPVSDDVEVSEELEQETLVTW
eukprot:CAMPEP_0197828816 /NCGR_PEP_ID=MMETSP1437-20131217/5338_1 /TAXON_ID=49252 ORGANISM="Eucampia antarctica, Strain CCMP1452" /NCGR_SAMPLE_ID=MMETSP1437 /ASSEMBLY_ACC=CAM_ASM_001096 /LENGTH=286 /DNA_ID=CAMNT_0043430211 /DNA_START=141 /DNA_END=998 /DNA_ORIENTATION=-